VKDPATTQPGPSNLPPPIEGAAVRVIAQLHAEHHQQASAIEHAIDRATATIGRPAFLGILTGIVCLWVGVNLLLPRIGGEAFDPPPFAWLVSVLALLAVYISVLILTTQRRADRLASRREQMTLELAFLSEHKTAKIIGLLEELRYDSPNVKDRIDEEANAMATPADARAVLDAIEETHEEMLAAGVIGEEPAPNAEPAETIRTPIIPKAAL
jgi:uncharacterized membrane protein